MAEKLAAVDLVTHLPDGPSHEFGDVRRCEQ